MIEAEQIMKRCQVGTRNYDEANNLHADCYRVIGKLLKTIAELESQDGACQHCAEKGCVACDARKQEPVKVSPLEFVEMVMEKEHLIGKPIFWAEWPNKEKSDVAQETNS